MRRWTRVAFSLVALLLLLLYSPGRVASQANCSKSCVAENCNSIGIRYGKYCGVGWTGCAGEKPCDDLDACCKAHDECVEKKELKSSVFLVGDGNLQMKKAHVDFFRRLQSSFHL
ncbi:Phospholipase A2-gamma [Acorus calamus]|uniref:Phospholipase A2-gamma n=1 Tax=Acorus calamus TaxID=4465 RepID=A0AAV9CD27_ACOCL|nr:Phospholipase A2-gamma [Acorus calamus]